jgi:hypothetical protein
MMPSGRVGRQASEYVRNLAADHASAAPSDPNVRPQPIHGLLDTVVKLTAEVATLEHPVQREALLEADDPPRQPSRGRLDRPSYFVHYCLGPSVVTTINAR